MALPSPARSRARLIDRRAEIRPAVQDDPSFCVNMLNLALVGEQQSRVRDLSGFRKSHRVPDEDSERSRSFVRRIAADDIGRDLDERFADFRRELGLKRVQMEVSDPHDGSGTITTPSFRYQVSADLSGEDLSSLIWRRRVSGFTAPESVLSDRFSATFGTTFNTVEFAPVDPVDVESFIDWIEDRPDLQMEPDYDRTATWCQITAMVHVSATMLIESHAISLTSLQPASPAILLRSFFAFRDLLPGIEWSR